MIKNSYKDLILDLLEQAFTNDRVFFEKLKLLLPEERNKVIESVYCNLDPIKECFGEEASNIINDFFANIGLN